jgi:hypothetical protein
MRIVFVSVLISLLLFGPSLGCAMHQKQVEEEIKSGAPVDCRTAEGDVRVLQQEKAHVVQRIVEGATAITPAGIVLGILTGTEGTKLRVAVGEYNQMIDERIALIQSTCGVE